MRKIISKVLFIAFFAIVGSSSVFAVNAKVTYVKGKVEVSRGSSWVALKVGDEISEADTISTGFQSEARLSYKGSVMAVPALTRITFEKLATSGNTDSVSLYVDTGAVRSKVTHTENERIGYNARSSVAVASVRGTGFDFRADGTTAVFEGAIAYAAAADFDLDAFNLIAELGSADAGTPSEKISGSLPKNSIVIGEQQSTGLDSNGKAKTALNTAKQKSSAKKSMVMTNAQKDMFNAKNEVEDSYTNPNSIFVNYANMVLIFESMEQ